MSDSIPPTIELVHKAQAGDQDSLNQLTIRYYPLVQRVVRLRMGQRLRQRMDSGDILQETFARAVRLFDRFEMRTEGSLINWLARLAEHTISDALDHEGAQKRDLAREQALPAATRATAAPPDVAAPLAVPLDKLIRDEEQSLLDACLVELPEQYRELIVLRNVLGLSFEEIRAETERPSEGAARMMHAKAMRELARLVERRKQVGK